MNKLFTLLSALLLAATPGFSKDFWLGADISGTTADEARGRFTRNVCGDTVETTRLMKDLGLNAVRLRVWVDPKDGLCAPEDVLKMALRARNLNLPVMIDFHYSDWWADPGKQYPPKAWEGMDLEQMKQALADHTRSTLIPIRDAGVDVKWVQVGNETTNGMLWELGRAPENMEAYAALSQAGYEAVKEVLPNTVAIVHLDNGFDQALYDRMFDGLKANGAQWDMIGMSVYPYYAILSGQCKDADDTIAQSIANIKHLKEKYGTDVMIVETGVDAREPQEGKAILAKLIDAALNGTDGICQGVWYWAPETNADEQYHLGAFANDRPTAIMEAFTEAAAKIK